MPLSQIFPICIFKNVQFRGYLDFARPQDRRKFMPAKINPFKIVAKKGQFFLLVP